MSYQEGAPPVDGEATNEASSSSPSAAGSYKNILQEYWLPIAAVYVVVVARFVCARKPLIDGSKGSYQAKSLKESEYNAPASAKIWWWQHPDVGQNWKAVLGSIVMLIVGILLMAAGILFEALKEEHVACTIFIIIGFLFFVPGLYHTGYIYFAAKGIRGFDMNQLSIFTMSR